MFQIEAPADLRSKVRRNPQRRMNLAERLLVG